MVFLKYKSINFNSTVLVELREKQNKPIFDDNSKILRKPKKKLNYDNFWQRCNFQTFLFDLNRLQKQISTIAALSPEGLYTILKNSEKVIIDEGMCIFVLTNVSVRYGILAQMKCLKVI